MAIIRFTQGIELSDISQNKEYHIFSFADFDKGLQEYI